MSSVNFTGALSVLPRTIFTNKGPIVKPAVTELVGADLYVSSPDEITITSGNFTSSIIGKTINISGSPGGRNDGNYLIKGLRSFNRLVLEASLDYSDPSKISSALIDLSNELKAKFSLHVLNTTVHEIADSASAIVSPDAVDLDSSCILLNEIKQKLGSHSITVGSPEVHKFADPDASILVPDAFNYQTAISLANFLRFRYEQHRKDKGIHLDDDFVDRLFEAPVKNYVGTGSMIGPFAWALSNPRNGEIADDPSDVTVLVNGIPADVDYVFGLLGAVVLSTAPTHGDTVFVDYKFLKNPPTQLQRLNSAEFFLNQENNRGFSGLPGHIYRQRSYLINPTDPRLVKSPVNPQKIGWKYKGYELKYTARLNDPSSLLLNSPTNRIMYPVFSESIFEKVIRYDPTSLPTNSTDPWVFYGEGDVRLDTNPSALEISDTSRLYGSDPGPPFYGHSLDLTYPSHISAAYRFSASDEVLELDGDYTGVSFGFTNGQKASIVGCLITDANNLSSAISMANDIKYSYTNHINFNGVHRPVDKSNVVSIIDAYDLDSLIILTNHLLSLYNDHLALGPNNVHKNQDIINTVTYAPCTNLETAIEILNTMRSGFNSHRIQNDVHYVNDTEFMLERIKQVGILTNRGFEESQYSWESFAYDWTIETTYRVYIDPDGNTSVYLSGDSIPRSYVKSSDLPNSSSLDLRFDPVFQAFFGSLGDNSSNQSKWRFARIDINPIDSVQLLHNKNVSYDFQTIPELDPQYPWITVGQGGSEKVIAPNTLEVSSMACVSSDNAIATGQITGEYRGYLRIEPSITDRNVIALEFSMVSPLWSFGVDNRSLGVFIGDGTFATQLCFLQANPLPATVIGQVYEPSFSINAGDHALFTIDNGPIIVVTASSLILTMVELVTLFNETIKSVIDYDALASAQVTPFGSTLKIESSTDGSASVIRVISGEIFNKLGIPVGVFVYGSDSLPEPKVSWAGVDLPDLDNPAWLQSGNQLSAMQERTLIIEDNSLTDFRSYIQNSPIVMGDVIISSDDWKADIRVKVVSHEPSTPVISTASFKFCGVMLNLDEGNGGKNIELHLSKDLSDQNYVVIYTFNPASNELDYLASYPYNWEDSEYHSYSLYTDKSSDNVSLFIDGSFCVAWNYSALNVGIYGPAISFGSGSNPVSNADLLSAKSKSEWTSVCAIHDSSVNNSYLASQRYVGLYKGGDTNKLSSYYLTQLDWQLPNTYRLVRDPISGVSVYINNLPSPSISAAYDVLTLPISTLDFLAGVVPSGKFIAWGSFNPSEISRSVWYGSVSYSLGKLSDSDEIVPAHQVLNQSNIIVSSEHSKSVTPHDHFGTRSYSGGTITDDFLSSQSLLADTILGTGTPPVPMTQDMSSQGGLSVTVTPVDVIPTTSFIYQNGQLANFIDDVENSDSDSTLLTYSTLINNFVLECADLRTKYLTHIVTVNIGPEIVHTSADLVNNTVTDPTIGGDLAAIISCLTDIIPEYNNHIAYASVIPPLPPGGPHIYADTRHVCTAVAPTDLPSAIIAFNSISSCLNSHIKSVRPHLAGGKSEDKLPNLFSALNLLKDLAYLHFSNDPNLYHVVPPFIDSKDTASAAAVYSLPYTDTFYAACKLADDIRDIYNLHRINVNSHIAPDFVNDIFSNKPQTIDELELFVFDLTNRFSAHIQNFGGAFHTLADADHIYVTDSNLEFLVRYLDSAKSLLNSHVVDLTLHNSADPDNQFLDNLVYRLYTTNTVCDLNDYTSFANALRDRLSSHYISDAHTTEDYVNYDKSVAIPDAVDFISSINSIYGSLGLLTNHNTQFTGINEYQAHQYIDSINLSTETSAYNLLHSLIAQTNKLISLFSNHILYKPSHVKIQLPLVSTPAIDLPSTNVVLNSFKEAFNEHLINPGVHVNNDLTDTIFTPDATDLDSAVLLFNSILLNYNNHLVLSGVHSSTAIIRLTPPSSSLYDGIKFFTVSNGTPYITSTFSDDETWKLGGVQNQKNIRFTYIGDEFPEYVSITTGNSNPFTDLPNKYLAIYIDQGDPVNVYFQPGDTTAVAIANRINGTAGIPAGFATATPNDAVPPNRVTLTNPNSGPGRTIRVDGDALVILGFDTSCPIPWALTSDDSGSVSVALTAGVPNRLTYGTSGPGTRTAYVATTGLTDGNLGFSITYKIKISSWSYLLDGDTGIYVGCSSQSGKGFTAGIGFMEVFGNKMVIVKDMNSGQILGQRAFNWGDGAFHYYTLTKDPVDNTLELTVE